MAKNTGKTSRKVTATATGTHGTPDIEAFNEGGFASGLAGGLAVTNFGKLMCDGTTLSAVINGYGHPYLGFNNFATQSAATEAYFGNFDQTGGNNIGTKLALIQVGHTLAMTVSGDVSKFLNFKVTSIISTATDYAFGVSLISASATKPFTYPPSDTIVVNVTT